MTPIRIGLLGIGTVGGGTYEVLTRNQEEITRRVGRPLVITRVADLDLDLARRRPAAPPGWPSPRTPSRSLATPTSTS